MQMQQAQMAAQQAAAGKAAAAAAGQAAAAAAPGKGKTPVIETGIPGLQEALMEALAPVAHMDSQWDIDEMVKRVHSYFTKAAKKYETDERAAARGSSVQAQALIEEFVSTA